jgi:flagellar hook-associated protein 1 FlgK
MASTFLGIELGKRAVSVHEQALNTTGHNLSNASTEGYSRQRVEFSAFAPLYLPGLNRAETPGQIGQGTVVERIARVRDQLLDQRIVAQASGEGFWETKDPYIRQMEQIYLEVGENSVRGKMDAFWDAWQELSLYPTDLAPRTSVVERGKTLIDGIHDRFTALKGLQDMAEEDVRLTVDRVNELSRQIAGLNRSIQEIRAQGDNPNDLLDRRDLLVDKLSSIIDITVNNKDPDEFMVHTAGMVLVQGHIGRQFGLERNDEGYSRIVWNDTGDDIQFRGGSLAALVDLRDNVIAKEIQSLDSMTMNFIDLVNEVHRGAYGANGSIGQDFFTELHFTTNVNGNYDQNGDGVEDSSYVFRINGANTLEERAQVGLRGTITLPSSDGGDIQVQYYETDTVAEVITRINNSGAEVTARLNREGQLSLKGTPSVDRDNPDFVIRHIEDSGLFLTGYAGVLNASGPAGAYDWGQANAVAALREDVLQNVSTSPVAHPSGWIQVNPMLLKDPSSVAAGFGENGRAANPGNGEAAAAIASIRNTDVMVGQLGTFDDYFADAVGRVGLLGEQSSRALETQNLVMKQLTDMRDSVSGVNMDEELANMIKYQHGYAAAARFVTTVNTMLDTLINRMGV